MAPVMPSFQDSPNFQAMVMQDEVDDFVNGQAAALGTGVVSGGQVTQYSTGTTMAVNVAAGVVAVQGVEYTLTAVNQLAIAAASSGTRRDAVVFRVVSFAVTSPSGSTCKVTTAQAAFLAVGMVALTFGQIASIGAPSGGNCLITLGSGSPSGTVTFTGPFVVTGTASTYTAADWTTAVPGTPPTTNMPPLKGPMNWSSSTVATSVNSLIDCVLGEVCVGISTTGIVGTSTTILAPTTGNLVDKTTPPGSLPRRSYGTGQRGDVDALDRWTTAVPVPRGRGWRCWSHRLHVVTGRRRRRRRGRRDLLRRCPFNRTDHHHRGRGSDFGGSGRQYVNERGPALVNGGSGAAAIAAAQSAGGSGGDGSLGGGNAAGGIRAHLCWFGERRRRGGSPVTRGATVARDCLASAQVVEAVVEATRRVVPLARLRAGQGGRARPTLAEAAEAAAGKPRRARRAATVRVPPALPGERRLVAEAEAAAEAVRVPQPVAPSVPEGPAL